MWSKWGNIPHLLDSIMQFAFYESVAYTQHSSKNESAQQGQKRSDKMLLPLLGTYILYNVYTRCAAYSYIHSALLTALAPLAAGACAGDAARQ